MKLKQPYMKQTKYTFLQEAKAIVKIAPNRPDWTPRKGVSRDELSHVTTLYNSRKISALVAMVEKLAFIILLRAKGSIHGVKKYIIHLRYRSSQLKPIHHLPHRHSRIPPIRPPLPSPGQAIFRTRLVRYMNRSSFGGRVQLVAIVTSILSENPVPSFLPSFPFRQRRTVFRARNCTPCLPL